MTAISSQFLAAAVVRVERMSFSDRERLADEVYARQPNLLASVLSFNSSEPPMSKWRSC